MARIRANSLSRPSEEFPTPRHEYIYSAQAIPYTELARIWKGVPGWSVQSINLKAAKEHWQKMRKEFWDGVRARTEDALQRKLAAESSDSIVEANRRHIQLGKALQTVGGKMIKPSPDGSAPCIYDPVKGEYISVRTSSEFVKLIKDGTDIERKALGLADQVVKVQFARDIAKDFVSILKKYVTDPDLFANIVRDVEMLVERERVELDEAIAGRTGVDNLVSSH